MRLGSLVGELLFDRSTFAVDGTSESRTTRCHVVKGRAL
jgi:hypothetical protein